MKIKYTFKDDADADLIYGRTYDVISIECDWYRIIDESGEDYMYPPNAFEIVDPLPAPPVLTDEDIKRGEGKKYVVFDPFGDIEAEAKARGEEIEYLDDTEEYRNLFMPLPKMVLEAGYMGLVRADHPIVGGTGAEGLLSDNRKEYCGVAEESVEYSSPSCK
jgi:hypothetical protein